jgi:hypothetical protein
VRDGYILTVEGRKKVEVIVPVQVLSADLAVLFLFVLLVVMGLLL